MPQREHGWDPEVVLARQLAMNRETWAVLQSHGVTDKTELRLDFNYKAAYRERADELAGFLRVATDYEVRADDASVSGTTPATSLSLEILDEMGDLDGSHRPCTWPLRVRRLGGDLSTVGRAGTQVLSSLLVLHGPGRD